MPALNRLDEWCWPPAKSSDGNVFDARTAPGCPRTAWPDGSRINLKNMLETYSETTTTNAA
jgi:hypothetical protein